MSKSAYEGIRVTPVMLDAVLVANYQGQFYRFQVWEDRIFIMKRSEEWRNWADFDDAYNGETDMEDLHKCYIKWYGAEAPKNAKKVTLTKAIWAKMYLKSEDRSTDYRCGPPKDPVSGKAERRRNLDGRMYRALVAETTEHLQAQAIVVHKELLMFQSQSGKNTLTEADVRDCMQRAAETGVLKTKQDPFRIFQYYRSVLMKAGKLEKCDE